MPLLFSTLLLSPPLISARKEATDTVHWLPGGQRQHSGPGDKAGDQRRPHSLIRGSVTAIQTKGVQREDTPPPPHFENVSTVTTYLCLPLVTFRVGTSLDINMQNNGSSLPPSSTSLCQPPQWSFPALRSTLDGNNQDKLYAHMAVGLLNRIATSLNGHLMRAWLGSVALKPGAHAYPVEKKIQPGFITPLL